MQHKIIHFFRDDLWQKKTPNSRYQQEILKSLKILILSGQGFIRDYGSLRASALTLYTLLSIVPVIAMLFGIAKGFGFESMLEQYLLEQVQDNDTMVLKLIEMAKNMLESTQGGLVAGFGIAILFWTVLKVIGNIEESFNHIWKLKKSRSLSRKISDYLSLMLFAPILMIAANSISVIVQVNLTDMINAAALPGTLMALKLLNYLSVIILWGLFSFIFIFMPNTRVQYSSGIFTGIIMGSIYYIAQSLYVSLQIGVSNYNAIYGSFAALPLFLIWLQIAWVIVLLGAEMCYFHQNIEHYQFNKKYRRLSFSSKKTVCLHIMHTIMQRFSQTTEPPYAAKDMSLSTSIPIHIIEHRLNDLIDCQLISIINLDETDIAYYQPACDINLLSDAYIVNALENQGEHFIIPVTP